MKGSEPKALPCKAATAPRTSAGGSSSPLRSIASAARADTARSAFSRRFIAKPSASRSRLPLRSRAGPAPRPDKCTRAPKPKRAQCYADQGR